MPLGAMELLCQRAGLRGSSFKRAFHAIGNMCPFALLGTTISSHASGIITQWIKHGAIPSCLLHTRSSDLQTTLIDRHSGGWRVPRSIAGVQMQAEPLHRTSQHMAGHTHALGRTQEHHDIGEKPFS